MIVLINYFILFTEKISNYFYEINNRIKWLDDIYKI